MMDLGAPLCIAMQRVPFLEIALLIMTSFKEDLCIGKPQRDGTFTWNQVHNLDGASPFSPPSDSLLEVVILEGIAILEVTCRHGDQVLLASFNVLDPLWVDIT